MSLPAATRFHCFVRSLFLQAAWNRRGMQNLGFAYAIEPALRRLYPEPAARRAAMERHLGFFNCQPYMAAAILGGAIHHEERIARGDEPPGTVTLYKQTLQGPLAAIGDGFFWTALRPMFGALAALATFLGARLFGERGALAALAAVLAYNAVHLGMRVWLFRAGYDEGDGVVEVIARKNLPLVADRLRLAAAALCGLVLGAVAWLGAGRPLPALVAAAAAVAGYQALARGARLLPTAYAAVMAVVGLAFLIHRWRGRL